MTFKFAPATPEELERRKGASAPEELVKPARRARGKKGQFQADDPSTPDVNEAWEAPKE